VDLCHSGIGLSTFSEPVVTSSPWCATANKPSS
jgi:hypothetical protein